MVQAVHKRCKVEHSVRDPDTEFDVNTGAVSAWFAHVDAAAICKKVDASDEVLATDIGILFEVPVGSIVNVHSYSFLRDHELLKSSSFCGGTECM